MRIPFLFIGESPPPRGQHQQSTWYFTIVRHLSGHCLLDVCLGPSVAEVITWNKKKDRDKLSYKSVHAFVLLLRLSFCSLCSAVVYSRLLCFSFLNLLQCLCGNLPVVVGVSQTQHFIACRCDRFFHSLPTNVNGFLFHQLLQRLELIGQCDTQFLPFVGIIQKKGVVPQALVCSPCQVPAQFELQLCNQEMVVSSHICPSPEPHILKSSSESLPNAHVINLILCLQVWWCPSRFVYPAVLVF